MKTNYTCSICEKRYTYTKGKGGSTVKCNSCITNAQRFRRKKKIHEHMGGKCSFDGIPSQFDCHHTNPDDKDFNISGNHCRAWAVVEEELKKCIYLCANCHRFVHNSHKE